MEKQIDKKFTWVIKNFSSLPYKKIYSDEFVAGGCRWSLRAYPKGHNEADHFSLYLAVADFELLPLGWNRQAKFSFTIVNHFSDKLSQVKETQYRFDQWGTSWGFHEMITFTELHDREGFMVNGDLVVVVKIDVLEVVGKSEETSPVIETIDVNGFQVLPSQVESVKRLFERHQDIASTFRTKNPYLKTAYITVLLSLTQSLCQSPKEISNDDLADKYAALVYLKDVGFELGWLEKKLDQVKEKKEKEEACLARLQEMEEQFKPLKRKYTDMEAQIDKVKAELSAASAPDLSLYEDNVA